MEGNNLEQLYQYNNQAILYDICQNQQDLEEVLEIPVVVHILHLGENTPSNITDAQVNTALTQLNSDFDNSTTGANAHIIFCLAKRDPEGNSTTGINRINASGKFNYDNIGMAMGNNEINLKTLSIWNPLEYLNIWIVHTIAGGTNSPLGFATFPTSPLEYDGIVVKAEYFGTTEETKVITHEAGHYLNLYHTFEGGNTSCPPNNNCDTDASNDLTEICCRVQGDRCCDTPPHRSMSGCPEGTNQCTNTSESLVASNFMNYTNNDCKNQFTADQVMRMRSALRHLRPHLLISLGCEEPCNSVTADFDLPEILYGNEDEQYSYIVQNTSSGFTNSTWTTFYHYPTGIATEVANTTNLEIGTVQPIELEICLTVSNTECVQMLCKRTIFLPLFENCQLSSECELILNPNFIENAIADFPYHYTESYNHFSKVCGWVNYGSSPWVSKNDNLIYFGGYNENNYREAFGTKYQLDFINGKRYKLSFDYYVSALLQDNLSDFEIGAYLAPYFSIVTQPENLPSHNIYRKTDLPIDGIAETSDHLSFNIIGNPIFNHEEVTFTYEEEFGKFLFFQGKIANTNPKLMNITNVHVTCVGPCSPMLDFTYDQHGCILNFNPTLSIEDASQVLEYHWDFGDNTTSNEKSPIHSYYNQSEVTSYEVCLTTICSEDETDQFTVCKTINAPICRCDDAIEPTEVITLMKCGEGDYIGNIQLQIPKGFKPCGEEVFIESEDITTNSFIIDDSNNAFDILSISVSSVNFPDGKYLYLCGPNGESECNLISFQQSECTTCTELSAAPLTCQNPDPLNDIHIYSGSIPLPNGFPTGATPCGATSTQAGFSYNGISNGNIDFSISTTNDGAFNGIAILCFEEINIKTCYKIRYSVDEPCPTCVFDFGERTIECSDIIDGIASFNFANGTYNPLIGQGYTLCANPISGNKDGLNYTLNNVGYLGDRINFDFDFEIPCEELESDNTLEVLLELCGPNGEMECMQITFILDCDLCGFNSGGRSRQNNPIGKNVDIFPNPTNNEVTILIKNSSAESEKELLVKNMNGQLLVQQYFNKKQSCFRIE